MAEGQLHAAFLAGTATVVRDRRDFFNQFDVQSGRLQGRDRTFAARTGAFDAYFDITHTELSCLFGRLLSGTLTGERRAFAASFETAGAGTGPAKRVTLGIRDGHCGVVERGVYVSNTVADVPADTFLFVGLCHRKFSNRSMNGGGEGKKDARPHVADRRDGSTSCGRSEACDQRKSLTPFLPATVLRGPLRVRALVLVRCPRTGKLTRCRMPR